MSENCKDCVYIQNLNKNIEKHEETLNKHEEDITNLKEDGREYKTEIKNLIQTMDTFINTIKWGLGIFVTVSIFILSYLIKFK